MQMMAGEDDEVFRARVESEPLPQNLGALLDEAVATYSGDPAWIFVDQDLPNLSYKELGELVSRSANVFTFLGVKKGSHVGVMLPNVPQNLAAWLALAKIGALMIPINPSYTPDELRYWLTDGDIAFLLIDSDKLSTFLSVESDTPLLSRKRVITWGETAIKGFSWWQEVIATVPTEFEIDESVTLDDLVNIQYTSGSTGLPKGCLLSQRYWIIAGKVISEVWPGLKRIQCDLPFYYMGPFWRFAAAAFTGAALCVPPAYSLSQFRKRVRDNAYDMAWVTAAVAMLDPDPIERDHSLRMIATFGIPPSLQASLAERYGVPVRDAYGMTEIGISIAVRLDDDSAVGTGSCGKALPFREVMIASSDGKEVPTGETGELCVSGPGILQGYYKKPEATNAAFRGKWFRTGDLARCDKNGYYYIIGRIKEAIRRSSENISITEVEHVLSNIPQVKDVAVHGVKDEKRGEEVKACLILREGSSPSDLPPKAVIEHCRLHLARFKVPRYVQYYTKFPRTVSNKIARKRLKDGEGEVLSGIYDKVTGRYKDIQKKSVPTSS
jgi:acyl-coenzyme A synthetase/AMP-(fatty) acid ligase